MEHISPGLLRTARSEVIPMVPMLAPHLNENPDIIKNALFESLQTQGIPSSVIVPEIDVNKTERHTIAGFLIGQQREALVEGEAHNAHFRDFHELSVFDSLAFARAAARISGGSIYIFKSKRETAFRVCLQKTLASGAREVRAAYTHGDSPEQQWFSAAAHRYKKLGRQAVKMSPPVTIPNEGRHLRGALRTQALSSTLPSYLRFIKKHVAEPNERLVAAHSLIHLLLTHSSLHVHEFMAAAPIDHLEAAIKNEQGMHRVAIIPGKDNRAHVYPRFKKLPNAKLKCPAHSAVAGDVTADTNLTYFMHAAINAATRYDLI